MMESELDSDSARQLAHQIAATPGWEAEAFLGMWPSETEPGKIGGSWVVGCARPEDAHAFILRSARAWGILQSKLAAGITPDSEKSTFAITEYGGTVCAIHNRPFMPLGWPTKRPALGEHITAWACPVCAGTMPDEIA